MCQWLSQSAPIINKLLLTPTHPEWSSWKKGEKLTLSHVLRGSHRPIPPRELLIASPPVPNSVEKSSGMVLKRPTLQLIAYVRWFCVCPVHPQIPPNSELGHAVSAEPGAVCVGEFGKEQKGDEEKERDGLTTARDRERVKPHNPGRGTACGQGWLSKGGSAETKTREMRERKSAHERKEWGKWATKIACLPGPDE
jgi:hypothetical protein